MVSLYLVSIAFTMVALIAYIRALLAGRHRALTALTAVLVAVVRFVGYFSTIVNEAQVEEEGLEPLRRSVPRVLRGMTTAGSLEHLPALLGEFGAESGLLAIRILNPKNERLKRWGWESPLTETEPTREAVCASFAVSDGQETLQVEGSWSRTRQVESGPQVYVLLQLVADGAEALLAMPREAIRTPAPSHSDRIARGGE